MNRLVKFGQIIFPLRFIALSDRAYKIAELLGIVTRKLSAVAFEQVLADCISAKTGVLVRLEKSVGPAGKLVVGFRLHFFLSEYSITVLFLLYRLNPFRLALFWNGLGFAEMVP